MYSQDQRKALFGDATARRTNLFAHNNSNNTNNPNNFRTPSPYEKTKPVQAYNESMMASLEAQNDEELNSIKGKVNLLKDLGMKMGNEIRGSSKTMDNLNETFNVASTKVKLTYNKMIVMSQNAGISWKVWFLFFFAVFLFFFWVWIT